jgi:hypothetical protein
MKCPFLDFENCCLLFKIVHNLFPAEFAMLEMVY